MIKKTRSKTKNNFRKRAVIFGIDGGTWEILKPMVKQNKLPNFKKLMQYGVYGNLKSVNPPVTCPAWATMLTGKNPASLGVFYFQKPTNNYDLKISPLLWKKWKPVWDIFSENGKKVCVFNIPTTTAYQINGYFISGPIWGEDYNNIAYPDSLKEKLRSEGYLVRPLSNPKVGGHNMFINEQKEITRNKFKTFFDFFLNDNWDLFIMSFNFGDTRQHYYWKYIDSSHPKYSTKSKYNTVIYDFYKIMDKYLGKILDNLPKNTVLVMTSDHGHKMAHTYVNLNAWLYQHDFLKIKKNYKYSQNKLIKSTKKRIIKSFYFITRMYSNLISLTNFIKNDFFKNLQIRLKTSTYVIENKILTRHQFKKYVDLENTEAYSLTLNTIYLNLKNREIKGSISEEDYLDIRERIISELQKLRDPRNNKKVINKIWTKEELYPENPPRDFPDIFIHLNKGYINYYSEIHEPTEIFSDDIFFSAEHSLDGIFLAYGPEIKSGKKIERARLEDVVPTILHICELSIPSDIDGDVLIEIFREDSKASQRKVIKEEKEEKISKEDLSTKKDLERKRLRAIRFLKKI